MLVFYISGHGFGHASRDIQVINALGRQLPGIRIVARSTVPRWFLDASLETPIDILGGETDTGVVQPDSLSIDEDATARHAAQFYAGFDKAVEREASLLRTLGASIVIGDVPPLAFAAAAAAGVPSIALANFTWDWIYEGFPQFDQVAPGVRATIADAYTGATLALRLPFAGGFTSMPHVEDVPLIGRRAQVSRDAVRQRLRIAGDLPVALASFGGHGRAVPLDRAASPDRFTLVATDYEAPDQRDLDGLRIVSARALATAEVSYSDLLAACDVVVTKLGYGIVSECIANDVALLFTFRGRFVEQDVFERDLPRVLRSRAIGRDDMIAGRWADAIDALLAQPAPPVRMRTDGDEIVARTIASAMPAS